MYAFSNDVVCNSEDVRAVVHDVLRHRIGLLRSEAENITSDIINKIVNEVEVPKIE
jgi:MoxR-like ATPase